MGIYKKINLLKKLRSLLAAVLAVGTILQLTVVTLPVAAERIITYGPIANYGDATMATNLMNTLCASRKAGFGAYINNISRPDVDGTISYKVNIIHKSCNDDTTAAYAIIGNKGLCKKIGRYGGSGNGDAFDCMKYVGKGTRFTSPGSGLECFDPHGNDADCINTDFDTYQVHKDKPPKVAETRSVDMSASVPGWANPTGFARIGGDTQLCQWFKVPDGKDWVGDKRGCQDLFIDIAWREKVWNLTPGVTVDPPQPEAGITSSVTGTGQISNAGDETDNFAWVFGKRVYLPMDRDIPPGGGDSGDAPATKFGSNWRAVAQDLTNGHLGANASYSTARSEDISILPIGSKVCFTMSVNPPSSTSSGWRHAISCATIGVKPKLQVWGYDTRVGGKILASAPSYKAPNHYGSWGEYGSMSAGANTQFMTNSSLSGDTRWNLENTTRLTFANKNACIGGSYGCFGTVNYPLATVQNLVGKCQKKIDGDATINNDTFASDDVVCVKGTAVIDGDIGDAPRLMQQRVLVASDIRINPNVNNISAWLVAHNPEDLSVSGAGNIVTCNIQKVIDNLATTNKGLTASDCSEPLQVNGFMIAKRIYSYRTTAATADDPGRPAEIYNLRANAFLWQGPTDATAPTVAQTKYVEELPPRF